MGCHMFITYSYDLGKENVSMPYLEEPDKILRVSTRDGYR